MHAIEHYTAGQRYLLDLAARQGGFAAPVGVDLDDFGRPLLKAARRKEVLPIDGVLVRDWDPNLRRGWSGLKLGLRLYEFEGIRFVQINFPGDAFNEELDFVVVDRRDYRRFYKAALRCRRDVEPPSALPIMPAEQADTLWKNTIGYLDRANLRRIRAYGGRPRRGILLTGSPGNGKTMACRWIWEECRRRFWQWRLVTPDAYREARNSCNPDESIRELFTLERRGVIFFDDMDLALRDRETIRETDDQAVFLTALDGLNVKDGVVFVFTTNCSVDLIDRAFKRPGRIDVILRFKAPDATLRRRLIDRWHADILAHISLDSAIASTDGYSFAEIEELKNLLILRFMETNRWEWGWALKQFALNRQELTSTKRHVGFRPAQTICQSESS